ncbi:MAG: 23S rRNA (guanosine(2251)-2'-O)-methyltransferase RlmB [Sneathiella sp.]|nr:23S rRNA (guanosine(2251)-2'-O)-methyltransferase RlmB [Sneathiella sp.]
MSRSKSANSHRRIPGNSPEKSLSARPRPPRRGKTHADNDSWLYGDHAVLAALANPVRKIRRLVMTRSKMDSLDDETKGRIEEIIAPEFLDKDAITNLLPENAIHQGIAALPSPLPDYSLEDLPDADDPAVIVVAILDQVTDPHNVGAILRSAAAFNVKALIVPDRHSPPMTGVLAKSASGALELVPVIRVGNLSRAMDQLAGRGFWRIGLDGHADREPEAAAAGIEKVAIVLGSEGKGLRHLTAEKCDLLAKLPMSGDIESLNVSNAAAIAFYELARQRKAP